MAGIPGREDKKIAPAGARVYRGQRIPARRRPPGWRRGTGRQRARDGKGMRSGGEQPPGRPVSCGGRQGGIVHPAGSGTALRDGSGSTVALLGSKTRKGRRLWASPLKTVV
ncbi:hypothetical protein DESPIG_02065 [Desulfovibrio piger ATCC 29098]|uniref:Uncharacterized protein n=1 Tax=Desulfovibrio piger ATCC 29098 TaxID=411464 RepID=B6WVE9_9BACT|nr:hypothetical protein DESPIG_02065 [Desulfovibrio piger ATCC 29098]